MSAHVDIPKAAAYETFHPATWFRLVGQAPMVSCGYCGTRATLADYTIASDGTVTPSLVCPTGCGYHVFARLLDWAEE